MTPQLSKAVETVRICLMASPWVGFGAMDYSVSTLERTFELAKSGHYRTVSAIKIALKKEGYSVAQLQGASLSAQLRKLIAEAKPK